MLWCKISLSVKQKVIIKCDYDPYSAGNKSLIQRQVFWLVRCRAFPISSDQWQRVRPTFIFSCTSATNAAACKDGTYSNWYCTGFSPDSLFTDCDATIAFGSFVDAKIRIISIRCIYFQIFFQLEHRRKEIYITDVVLCRFISRSRPNEPPMRKKEKPPR
jgi:hypothetical protein